MNLAKQVRKFILEVTITYALEVTALQVHKCAYAASVLEMLHFCDKIDSPLSVKERVSVWQNCLSVDKRASDL